MQAGNRTVKDWLDSAMRGALRLPRFQRGEAWTHHHVERFLTAMLRRHPLGVFLILNVDPDNQPFRTRRLGNLADSNPKCTEHLLDGQQRLTSLLRVFNDSYGSHAFYYHIESNKQTETDDPSVIAVSRTGRDRATIGDPRKEYNKAWIPMHLITPIGSRSRERIDWRQKATKDPKEREKLEVVINDLSYRIAETMIPFLSLPQATSKSDAIKIFLETNRSSVNLSAYDLAVAQMEDDTGNSLQELVDEVIRTVPRIKVLEPRSVGDMILKSECVIQGKKPTLGNYQLLDFAMLSRKKEERVTAIIWTVNEFDRLKIWSERRLPTAVPLRVLPGLKHLTPIDVIDYDRAMKLVRRYLWCSFLTDRYDRQANDRLKEDYDALVKAMKDLESEPEIPALTCKPPETDDIKDAGWPKSVGRLSRGILAACCQDGAKDIASNEELQAEDPDDYHYIFPKSLLKQNDRNPNTAINCMLLKHHRKRRKWQNTLPGDFLQTMIDDKLIDQSVSDPANEIKSRLKTHLLPVECMTDVTKAATTDVARAYDKFLEARIALVADRIEILLKRGELR